MGDSVQTFFEILKAHETAVLHVPSLSGHHSVFARIRSGQRKRVIISALTSAITVRISLHPARSTAGLRMMDDDGPASSKRRREETPDACCVLCMEVLVDPVTLRCGHNFDSTCMHTLMQREDQVGKRCPTCRARSIPSEPPPVSH